MESQKTNLSDLELVNLAQNGDRTAFDALIRRYQIKIVSLCARLIGRSSEARDLAADVFAEAYQSLPRFKKEAKFSTWLYRIASNRSFSHLKNLVRDRNLYIRQSDSDTENEPQLSSKLEHPLHRLELEEMKLRIRIVLTKLNQDHARILLLHDLEELPYAEISEIMNCAPGTVMSRLSRAREAFRKKWNQMNFE